MGDSWRYLPGNRNLAAATPGIGESADDEGGTTRLDEPAQHAEPAPEIAARRSAATSYGDLAAIIRLQSTEMERLAHDNERLMDRLDTFFRLHENEQNLRQQLQEQIQNLSERTTTPTLVYDAEEIRREARESVIDEIKPVLVSMLDLLERSLKRVAVPGAPAAQATRDPLPMDEFLRLPEILTRPLEELTTRASDAPAQGPSSAGPREIPSALAKIERPWARDREDARVPALPRIFAWTNLFS